MKKHIFNIAAIVAAGIAMSPLTASATELITNSNFGDASNPNLASWTPSGNVQAFSDSGLENTAPGLTGSSPNGAFADFNPFNGSTLASLAQPFDTLSGQTYSLALQYGAVIDNQGSTTEEQTLGVTVTDGAAILLNQTVTAFGDENLSTAFTPYSFSFTGDGGADTLVFTDESATSSAINGVLTGVTVNGPTSVSAAPEPASWVLMIFGVAGIGAAMRMAPRKGVTFAVV